MLTTITQAARNLRVPHTTLRLRLKRAGVSGRRFGNYVLISDDEARKVMEPIHPRGIGEVYDHDQTH
jgi:hypothetical protein